MTAVPPFKESSRELIVEVARALEPYFPDITNHWRDKLVAEFGFDGRTLAALERVTLAAGCSYFCHDDFPGFQENLQYFGTRLSKLQVDTRAVARSLELYQLSCDPYLSGLFPEREAEAKAALEMLSSVSFVIVSGAYFDAKTLESQALPLEDKATESFNKSVEVSQKSGVYSDWVIKAQDYLREYQPDSYGDVHKPAFMDSELSRSVSPDLAPAGSGGGQ